MSTVKDIDGERIAKILQFATEAEALPELCNFVDYDPDIGKVPEHWEPKVYVWLVVKHVAESELDAAIAKAKREVLLEASNEFDKSVWLDACGGFNFARHLRGMADELKGGEQG